MEPRILQTSEGEKTLVIIDDFHLYQEKSQSIHVDTHYIFMYILIFMCMHAFSCHLSLGEILYLSAIVFHFLWMKESFLLSIFCKRIIQHGCIFSFSRKVISMNFI